jgi:ATP-dependent exoDNAse (exonuclease V) beta subunit
MSTTPNETKKNLPTFYRLPINFNAAVEPALTKELSTKKNIPLWQNNLPAKIGTIIHTILQYMRSPLQHPSEIAIKNLCAFYDIYTKDVSIVEEKINQCLDKIKDSSRAQWILKHTHEDAMSEYAITLRNHEEFQSFSIDRTFIDQGIRWIIDYKTSEPALHESIEKFIFREKQNYQQQLENYAKYFKNSTHPIYLGLYFPLIDEWCEWCYKK